MTQYMITKGGALKSVGGEGGIRDSWDFVEAMANTGDVQLYAKVSAVYRAANLTADAISNMPFAVMKGKTDIDSSAEWKNVIGTMPNPRQLLRLWRMSLFMTNTAYARLVKTNSVKRQWFYVVPNSIRIETDPLTGEVKELQRVLGAGTHERYQPDDPRLFKMWKLDYTTELLPSPNTEFLALSNSAGVLHAADFWTRNHFANGAVKPTVLSVKGMPTNDKKEELKRDWSRFMRSLGKKMSDLVQVINGDAMDAKQIGEGLGDIKDSPVYKQAIENVAMASGMPLSLLLANSANYATAQAEYAAWFRDSVTPAAYLMQEAMNEQIFKPAGLYFEFRPETAEPSQQEEVERANAFSTYVSAGVKLSVAAQIVGVDLPAGMEYDDLDPEEEEPIPAQQTVPAAPPQAEDGTQPQPDAQGVEEDDEDLEDEDEPTKGLTFEAYKELDIWKRKATKAAKNGKPLPVDFVCNHIPDGVADVIKSQLQRGVVDAAFEFASVKREFGSDEERRAAFARMAEDGDDMSDVHPEHRGEAARGYERLKNGDITRSEVSSLRDVAKKQEQRHLDNARNSNEPDYVARQKDQAEKYKNAASAYDWILNKYDKLEKKSADIAAVKDLAAALDRATAAAMQPAVKAEPMPQPVINVTMPSITLNAQMPAQDAPTVTVNIPEQPAPVVNVQPAEVKVQNAPANVTVNIPPREPITAELTTDPRTGKKVLKAK